MELLSLLFWLFVIALFLLPHLRQQQLASARAAAIRNLERRRGSRVITLIHRQERIGFFGFPIYRYIDIEDSEAILRAIRTTSPEKPIDLILHTPGGMVLAAAQIAMALKRHPAKTTVIIPHYAMSGGTLIALAADEIIMDPDAVLGPVDPQIPTPEGSVVPAVSVLAAVQRKGDSAEDGTLILADMAEKAVRQLEDFVVNLLRGKMEPGRAREVAKTLARGKWTHDYPITVEEARSLGLVISTQVPPEAYQLMELYPQSHQAQRPGVEFRRPPGNSL